MSHFPDDPRVALVAHFALAAARPQRLGRTQLMKLLYFLQELKGEDLGYDFRLFTFGPFDSEVLGDLSIACARGAVVEETFYYPGGYGYDIKPQGPVAQSLSDWLRQSNSDLTAHADEVFQEFGAFGAADLELRSTIVFVNREDPALPEDALVDRVRSIKPHFDRPYVQQCVSEMAQRNWVHFDSPR